METSHKQFALVLQTQRLGYQTDSGQVDLQDIRMADQPEKQREVNMTPEQKHEDYQRIWPCINAIKNAQEAQSGQLSDVRSQLSEIVTILGERCKARELAVNVAVDTLCKADKIQDVRIDNIEAHVKAQQGDIKSLELSRAKIAGAALTISAISGVASGFIVLAFGG